MAGHSTKEISMARAELAARDSALATADRATPPFAWREKEDGLPGLVQLIVEQQVSTASAAAMWNRFRAGVGTVTAGGILEFDEPVLKRFGLSGQKVRYIRGVAAATLSGELDFKPLRTLGDGAAVEELTRIKGVGLWTAEAYLMGCEGRTDIFPAGDLALQEGLRMADGATDRLGKKELYLRAEGWHPYRGVAAHLLWAYYATARRKSAPILATDAIEP